MQWCKVLFLRLSFHLLEDVIAARTKDQAVVECPISKTTTMQTHVIHFLPVIQLSQSLMHYAGRRVR